MFETAEIGSAISKGDYEAQLPQLRVDLLNAQYDLRQADFPVLLLIAGDDRLGCNDLLTALHEWMDARYLMTRAFGPRSDEEGERPRFWRFWRALPRDGRIGVHFGGWALNAAAERIQGQIDDEEFDRHIAHANHFERALVDDGALLLKFWLHLPKKEHRKRIKRAQKDASKEWRVDEADWRICDSYDEGIPVIQRMLRKTEHAKAPWRIVESTDARYRNLTVGRTILEALEKRLAEGSRVGPAEAPAPAAGAGAPAGATVLGSVDLSASFERDEYREALQKQQARLKRHFDRARDEDISTVLVLEGWDAAGKGGVIRRITGALDARDYRLIPIAAPSDEEKRHHYLWRFWLQLPPAGTLLVFDRSWYGRVLVERVENLTPEPEWRRAYAEINDFEEQLVESGIVLSKFWLHIDPDEQLRRFKARENTGYKKYKITEEDYRNRARWSDYEAAVNEMVARTSTDLAPWKLVSANDKRWARVQVLKAVADSLKGAHKTAQAGS